ncbi:TKL protein kinase [Pelomyxa schiedti]|nr:TKL protein kinase [Pelomyxa schiedti]
MSDTRDCSATAKLLWNASARGDASAVGEILQSLGATRVGEWQHGVTATATTTPIKGQRVDPCTAFMSNVVDAHVPTEMNDGKQAGSTPLWIASHNGHINVVELLVTKGNADVNKATSGVGTTPLFVASQKGHIDVVELLVTKGNADVNKATSDDGTTPLYVASHNGHINVVELLVTKGNADVNKARSNDGITPLYVASHNGHIDVVELLVTKGNADVNKATSDVGATPLYVASQNGHINVVELLVTKGNADVNKARSDIGATPLVIAGSQSHKRIVDLLVCCGAAPPQNFQSSLDGNASPLVKALMNTTTTVVDEAGLLRGVTAHSLSIRDGETPGPRESTCCLWLLRSEVTATVKDAINTEIHESITDRKRRQQETPRILARLNSICEVRNQVMKRPSQRFSALSFTYRSLDAWLEVAKNHCQGAKETAEKDSAGTVIASTKVADTQIKVTTLEDQMKECEDKLVTARKQFDQATQESKRAMGYARSCAQIIWWLQKEKDAVKRGLEMARSQLHKLNQVASTNTLQALSTDEVANLLIPELHLFAPSYHQPSCTNNSNGVAEAKEKEDELRKQLLRNNVNGEALEQLTNEDMVDLGLTNVLHRKAIFHVVESVKVFGIIPSLWNCHSSNTTNTALSWTEEQVGQWLSNEGFGQLLKETTLPGTSKSRLLMPGWAIVHLTHSDLKSLGLTAIGDLRRLSTKISTLKSECFRKGTPNGNNGAPNDGTTSTSTIAPQDPNVESGERALQQPEVLGLPTVPCDTREQNPKETVLQAIFTVTWEQLNENLHEIVNSNGTAVLSAAEGIVPLCEIPPNEAPQTAVCCTSTSSPCESLDGLLQSTAKKTTAVISHTDENVMPVPPQCDSIYSLMEKKYLHCPSNNIILLNQALRVVSKLAEEQFPSFIQSLSSALKCLRNVSEGGKSVESAKTQIEETKKLHGAAVEELKLLKNALLESEEKLRRSVVQSRAHREFLMWLCMERDDIRKELASARRDHETITSLFTRKSFTGLTSTDVARLVIPETALFSWSHESRTGTEAKEQKVCELFMKNMMDGEALDYLPDDKAVLKKLGLRELLPRKALCHFIRHHVIGSASTPTSPPLSATSSPATSNKADCGTQLVKWTPQQVEKWFEEQIAELLPHNHNPGESAASRATSTPDSRVASSSTSKSTRVGATRAPPGWAFEELKARDIMDLFPTVPIGIVCKLAHRITLLASSSSP